MQHVYAHFGGGCICQVVLLKLLSDSINDLLQYLTGHCHFYTHNYMWEAQYNMTMGGSVS